MKLYNQKNVEDFKRALSKCKGDVFLTTPDGSKYNMKSFMSCISGLARLTETDTAELWCDNRSDEGYFMGFFNENPDCLNMSLMRA